MSGSYFQFRQFRIDQEHCAMKVTRDACLLGAWADVEACARLLDVGTGTGLLALMCAQRSDAMIDALELNAAAATQARANSYASPWAERIKIHHQSLQQWLKNMPRGSYDGIISNPPFFIDSLRCPDAARNQARHTDQLDYALLIQAIDQLLSADGRAWLLLPTQNIERLCALLPVSLHVGQICRITHSLRHNSKRALLRLQRQPVDCIDKTLPLFDEHEHYTADAQTLLSPYYLRLGQIS